MATLGVQGSDALFKGKQTLVDLCTLHTTLPVVTLAISGALRPRQIYEQKLSDCPALAISYLDLADGMGAGGGVIGCRGSCRPRTMAVVDDLIHLIGAFGQPFG